MKIILKTKDITSCIEVERDDLDIFDIWQELIKPALLGMGYQLGSIKDLENELENEEEKPIKPIKPNRVPGNDINTGKF